MDLGLASGKAMGESAASSSLASTSASASADIGAPIIYGRVDAENEDNLELLSSVAEHGALGRAKLLRPSPAQPGSHSSAQRDDATMQGTAALHVPTTPTAGSLSSVSVPAVLHSLLRFSSCF